MKLRNYSFHKFLVIGLAGLGNSYAKSEVNKCCQLGEGLEIFNQTSVGCQKSKNENPEYWNEYDVKIKMIEGQFRVVYGMKLTLDESPENICLDFDVSNNEPIGLVLIKMPPEAETGNSRHDGKFSTIWSLSQCIGILFLTATGLFYLKITPSSNSYHEKALIGHTLSLAMAMALYTLTFFQFLNGFRLNQLYLQLGQTCHLCSDLWLMAMWINIWLLGRHPKSQGFECRTPALFSFVLICAVAFAFEIFMAEYSLSCNRIFENFDPSKFKSMIKGIIN